MIASIPRYSKRLNQAYKPSGYLVFENAEPGWVKIVFPDRDAYIKSSDVKACLLKIRAAKQKMVEKMSKKKKGGKGCK